jgi:hypothetical protein
MEHLIHASDVAHTMQHCTSNETNNAAQELQFTPCQERCINSDTWILWYNQETIPHQPRHKRNVVDALL